MFRRIVMPYPRSGLPLANRRGWPGRTIQTVKVAIECCQLTLILLSHQFEIDLLSINQVSFLRLGKYLGRLILIRA
jgi:hypothetical protein